MTVVSEEQVKAALSRLDDFKRDLYIIVLSSGLRVTETLRLIETYDTSKLTWLEGGCARHPLMWIRRVKEAYYAYLSPFSFRGEKIQRVNGAGLL